MTGRGQRFALSAPPAAYFGEEPPPLSSIEPGERFSRPPTLQVEDFEPRDPPPPPQCAARPMAPFSHVTSHDPPRVLQSRARRRRASVADFIRSIKPHCRASMDSELEQCLLKYNSLETIEADLAVAAMFHRFLRNTHDSAALELWRAVAKVNEIHQSEGELIARENRRAFQRHLMTGGCAEEDRRVTVDPTVATQLHERMRDESHARRRSLLDVVKPSLRDLLHPHMDRFLSTDKRFLEFERRRRRDLVNTWRRSFTELMRCPVGRKVFLHFLTREKSEENLLFYLCCERLREKTDPEDVHVNAREIFDIFIGADQQDSTGIFPDNRKDSMSPSVESLCARVNVTSQTRQDIQSQVDTRPTNGSAFKRAEQEVWGVMCDQSYPRFLKSHVIQLFLQGPKRRKSQFSWSEGDMASRHDSEDHKTHIQGCLQFWKKTADKR